MAGAALRRTLGISDAVRFPAQSVLSCRVLALGQPWHFLALGLDMGRLVTNLDHGRLRELDRFIRRDLNSPLGRQLNCHWSFAGWRSHQFADQIVYPASKQSSSLRHTVDRDSEKSWDFCESIFPYLAVVQSSQVPASSKVLKLLGARLPLGLNWRQFKIHGCLCASGDGQCTP